MRSSDENRKRRSISLSRKKQAVARTLEYPKKDVFDHVFSASPPIGTLAEGIERVFVDANPRRLEKWTRKCEELASDPELILFAVLLCGSHFRITQPDIPSVLGQLWTWLTQHPQNMDKELAELLIDALTPALKQTIENRGQKKGWPEGVFERERGRPPKARGALAASVIAERLLSQNGATKGIALDLSTDLAAILSGRQHVERLELYRIRKRIPTQTHTSICNEIAKWYEQLLMEDGARTNDRKPESESREQQAEWKQRHKDLTQTLYSYGWEQLTAYVLQGVPKDLWQPFWRLQPSKTGRNDETVK